MFRNWGFLLGEIWGLLLLAALLGLLAGWIIWGRRAQADAVDPVVWAASKPQGLGAPRNGQGDDLTQISGIGPALKDLCYRLGYYHFDQIAAWTAAEVAWVDANLEGFKGRVSRDEWVKQAKALAS